MLRFVRFVAPNTYGPDVDVHQDDIVAVEQSHHDDSRQCWRTLLHLRGGSTLLLNDSHKVATEKVREAKAAAAKDRQT